jgi:hypothetical protein
MGTPFLQSFACCGERVSAPCCVQQLRSFDFQGTQNPASQNKENKMKRFLCTSSLLLAAVLVLLTFSTQILAAGTPPKVSAQQARGQGDGPGGDVVLSDLPDMSAVDVAAARREIDSPRNPHFTAAGYEAAKMAASRNSAGTRSQDASHLRTPRSLSEDIASGTPGNFANFLGASQGCNGVGWVPSDMGLAVSSTYVVQVVNECVTVFNKSGAVLSGPKDLCGIFGLPANSGSHGCYDPRALYDAQANKFVVITSYQDNSGNSWILTAAAPNPTLAWHHHSVFRGAGLADYPMLGQTAFLNNATNSVITVCDNFFAANGGFYDECLFMPKKGVYGVLGSFPVWFNFTLGGVVQNSMQPVNSYELSDNPRAQYTVNTLNDGGGVCNSGGETGLLIWAFSGNTAGQTHASSWFTGCNTTSFYSIPGNADDGTFCTSCVETLDNRISAQTFYSQGVFYPSIDTNNGGTSAVLGWRVHPYLDDNGGGCTSGVLCPNLTGVGIENEYCYDCGGGHAAEAWFGAQGPDPENDWTMFATFASGSSNISPGQFYTSNRVSWLTPFHDSGIFACQNNHSYGQGRWGDYSAVAPDDPGTTPAKIPAVWGSGMYVQSNGAWGTCIAGVHPQSGP